MPTQLRTPEHWARVRSHRRGVVRDTVPAIAGRAVFRGAALAATTAVGADRALTAPSALMPVTRTRIVRPPSALVSR